MNEDHQQHKEIYLFNAKMIRVVVPIHIKIKLYFYCLIAGKKYQTKLKAYENKKTLEWRNKMLSQIEMHRTYMESLSGINSVVRGDPNARHSNV